MIASRHERKNVARDDERSLTSDLRDVVIVFTGASRPTTIHRQDGSNSSSGAIQPEAPFVCVQPGFFGDLTDCTRFYRCVDFFGTGERFTLFTFVCGEGTIFDESLSVCNHPSWVSPPPACLSGNASSSAGVTPGNQIEFFLFALHFLFIFLKLIILNNRFQS